MNTKHTPGPWFSTDNGWHGTVVTHNSPVTDHILQICAVQCTGAKTLEEGKANARLLALAPELAEALRGLVKVIQEAMPPDYASQPYTASRLHAARAVLAKLEGGEA